MEFRILGPLEVCRERGPVALGGGKPRALIAMLLLHANEPVSAERLAGALWGEDAPPAAVATVRVHVSRLRNALGDDAGLTTTAAGYRLRVQPGELDAHRFERLLGDGRRALTGGLSDQASELLREALALWRGPALADLAFEPFAQAEIARLEEQRVAALELRIDADLAAGRHAELVPELRRVVAEHPLRERLHAQLMLALYRNGRQADALDAYRSARELLVDRLGIEPGHELRDLHADILRQAATLRGPRDDTVGAPAGSVPMMPNPTIGREREVATITALLRDDDVHLVTLVGPGGVGKTRLAIEVAHRSPDAWFVGLAGTTSPEFVAATIAQAMGVAPRPGESPARALLRELTNKRTLVVLDNFEHLLDCVTLVAELVQAAPGLRVLATSREPLNLQAERVCPVGPLPIADLGDHAAVASSPATELFVARARARRPEFRLDRSNAAAVGSICARLDGLPLAIELAAARVDLLAPTQLAERLEDALAALGCGARDAPERHRSMRAAIDWSYRLLDADERAAFARLSVFAGGCSLTAAERVSGATLDALDGLVRKNLLARDGARLTMLETMRQYARRQLGAGDDAATIAQRHCDEMIALAEQTEPDLERFDARPARAVLDAEAANMRAALTQAIGSANGERALRLACALQRYWELGFAHLEGGDWIERALRAAGDDAPAGLRARALIAAASFRIWADDYDAARAAAEQALALARAADDDRVLAAARLRLARAASHDDDIEGVRAHAAEALALARTTADKSHQAGALAWLATTSRTPAELAARTEQAADVLRRHGDAVRLADLYSDSAYIALRLGDNRLAQRLLDQAEPLTRALGHRQAFIGLRGNQGLTRLFRGDPQGAAATFREQLELTRAHGLHIIASEGLIGLAAVAALAGQWEHAGQLLGAAEANRLSANEPEVERRVRTTYLEPGSEALGNDAWNAALTNGRSLTLEQALTLALSPAPASRAAEPCSKDRVAPN